MFCERLEWQFSFTISLKLPVIEQVVSLPLLSRWGKKGGIIRLFGQGHTGPK